MASSIDLSDVEPRTAMSDGLILPISTKPAPAKVPWLQFFPPQVIEWNRLDLPLANWPAGLEGLRILHLSDAHLRRRWPNALDALLQRIQENPPDLLLFTGDFVDHKRNYRPAMPNVRRLVEGFAARFGCFAIHGNHDNYAIGRELRNSRVTFLDGRRTVVHLPGGAVELIGLPGKARAELELFPEVIQSFPARQSGVPRIVLSHFPDHFKRTGGLEADLFLCGHTHGGQICLPTGTAILWHDSMPRRFAKGAHGIGNTWLVVSRGLGWTGLPIRAFCGPEVLEICLGTGSK